MGSHQEKDPGLCIGFKRGQRGVVGGKGHCWATAETMSWLLGLDSSFWVV